MKRTDIIFLTRRLSFLLGAGMPLAQAINLIAQQSRKTIQKHLHELETRIQAGESLSSSFSQYPKYYSAFVIQLILAGEASSQLQAMLLTISETLEQEQNLHKRIVSMSIYPCVIALGTLGLSFFLLFFIFPKIKNLFQSLHATLPLSTRFLIALSDFCTHHILLIISCLIIFISIGIYLSKKSLYWNHSKDFLLISLPAIKTLIRYRIAGLFFRMTGTMLDAHVPIHQALTISAESLPHFHYKTAALSISEEVHIHGKFSESLAKFPRLFDETSYQLISAGEMSGTLSTSLLFIAHLYEQELEEKIKVMMNLLEPALMGIMGLIVGFISISIITPVYEITQNLQH